MADKQYERFASEVEKLNNIVQENESIQEDVTQNVESVKEELGQVEVLMKGMKSDVLQYRYALEGMTEYSKELDTIYRYCTAVDRNSKAVTRGSLRVNPKAFLDGLMDIYTSYEYVSNHTTLREHAELVGMQSRIMKQMVDECREMMASLLKGENVEYIPSESSEVNSADKEALFNTYFGISPENLKLLKDISSTLRSCGKYGYMNDLRTFMAMFMKRIIRGIIAATQDKKPNKPKIEIMADVYDATLKYLEIEFFLTTELFGDDRAQFARIIADATTQFMDLWEDALASVRELLTRPITEASDITEYLSELCATVNSAAIFIAFIADDEPRYQLLLRDQAPSSCLSSWARRVQEVQESCGQLMLLVFEMLGRNAAPMNPEATVSVVASSIVNYLRTINHFADKLGPSALRGFASTYPVIVADFSLSHYQRYTATVLLALREYLVRSTSASSDLVKSHLYLTNNYYYIMDGVSSGQLSVCSFIPTFMKRLFDEEFNAYMQLSWQRLATLASNPIQPELIDGKAIQPEERKFIKGVFEKWNALYAELVPSQFMVDVPSSVVRGEIMKVVETMVREYKAMWEAYAPLPFSLHHKKQYLLHDPEEVEYEMHSLFSRPV